MLPLVWIISAYVCIMGLYGILAVVNQYLLHSEIGNVKPSTDNGTICSIFGDIDTDNYGINSFNILPS